LQDGVNLIDHWWWERRLILPGKTGVGAAGFARPVETGTAMVWQASVVVRQV